MHKIYNVYVYRIATTILGIHPYALTGRPVLVAKCRRHEMNPVSCGTMYACYLRGCCMYVPVLRGCCVQDIHDCHANGVCIWLTGISTFLMERTTTIAADVPKFSAKLVLQATDQHAGGEFNEIVLQQRGVSFERLNNFMNLSLVRLHAYFLCALTFSICFILCEFAMQNRERVVDLAPSRAATACTMEGRVELVVLRGKAYFESEESLSNFLGKSVSYV